MALELVRGSTKGAEPGWAYVKEKCSECGRVTFAYVQLDVPVDEPACRSCKAGRS